MIFQEQYSMAITRFFKEHRDDMERLREMLHCMRFPSNRYEPSNKLLTVGDSNYHLVQVQGVWEIHITNKEGNPAGDITAVDGFLLHSDKHANRVVAYDVEAMDDTALYEILLDNY